MKTIEFNLNDYVQVRLTDLGRCLHEQEHEMLSTHASAPYKPPEELDGWSRWQAWRLMELFGQHMHNGCNVPFETTIRIELNN